MTRTNKLLLGTSVSSIKILIMKIKALIIAVLFAQMAFGQQEGQFIQALNNPYVLNPAAGGMTKVMRFELGIRNQWTGFSNEPQSVILSGHSRIGKGGDNAVLGSFAADSTFYQSPKITGGEFKHVVGGFVINETIGPFNRITAQGSYAVHMPLVREVTIGAGLSAGFNNFGIIQDRVVLYEEDDAAYMQFLSGASNQLTFNMNGGVIIYHPKFSLGFSTLQLLQNDAIFEGVATESVYNRHFYFTANYGFDISDKLEVRPAFAGKIAKNTPFNVHGALKVTYNDAIWGMAGYRTNGALTFQLGANLIRNVYLAYGYEHGIGPLQIQGNGTHEIQIGYYLGKKQKSDQKENTL